jgi:hypothetical protein
MSLPLTCPAFGYVQSSAAGHQDYQAQEKAIRNHCSLRGYHLIDLIYVGDVGDIDKLLDRISKARKDETVSPVGVVVAKMTYLSSATVSLIHSSCAWIDAPSLQQPLLPVRGA